MMAAEENAYYNDSDTTSNIVSNGSEMNETYSLQASQLVPAELGQVKIMESLSEYDDEVPDLVDDEDSKALAKPVIEESIALASAVEEQCNISRKSSGSSEEMHVLPKEVRNYDEETDEMKKVGQLFGFIINLFKRLHAQVNWLFSFSNLAFK